MSDWSQRPDALERDFQFADFKAAMVFVNRVADAAEAVDTTPTSWSMAGTRCG